jgi:hypothetical protein
MRRTVPVLVAAFALTISACGDVVAPPRQETPETTLRAVRQLGDRSFASIVASTEGADAQVITFQLMPEGGSVRLGEFTLDYEAGAVCDPETSGYGPSLWKTDCTTLTTPITITATLFKTSVGNIADFSPDIRFSPDKQVTLSVRRPEIIGQSVSLEMYLKYTMWYSIKIGDTRFYIDEAWFDSELYTRFDTLTGTVSRRLRHFTGYVVHSGYCEENPNDPECQEGGEGGGGE